MSASTNALCALMTALRRAGLFSIAISALFIYLTPGAQAQSALDGFNPGVTTNTPVRAVAVQPDGKIIVGGDFTSIAQQNGAGSVTRNHIARFNPDGTLDSFNPDADGIVDAIVVQPDGKISVSGFFSNVGGQPHKGIARLNADGSVDSSFANPDLNSEVYSIAVQTDGSIVAGGAFTTAAGGTPRNRIARFNANGALDASFDPNATGGSATAVRAVVLQSNGKILVGGSFTTLTPNGGTPVSSNYIARLNADGTVDTTFNSPATSGSVFAIAVQADGKILAGGTFTDFAGTGRNYIVRLNTNGTVDTTFNPPAPGNVRTIVIQTDGRILVGGVSLIRLNMDGTADSFNLSASSTVFAVAVQSDGKVLAGGSFTTIGGQSRFRIARIERDGKVEQTLDINVAGSNGNGGTYVFSAAVQPDGKIIIGGRFSSVLGTSRSNIARINTDGTLDANFNPTTNNDVYAIAVQPDGKIIIGGLFNDVGGLTRSCIARLDGATGAADSSFTADANTAVRSIALQPDGEVLVGGDFQAINGTARNYIARLNASSGAVESFDPNANSPVSSIAVQSDGKIIIGGVFTTLTPNGGAPFPRNHIARLNTDGTPDSFDPDANSNVTAVAVQSNGKILVGGDFSNVGGQNRNRIARLNTDGTADSFDPNVNGSIISIAVQSDGKVLAGGNFTSIGGQTRSCFARLKTDGTADSFVADANGIVFAIAPQSDGKILIGGNFTIIGGTARSVFARLSNDTAALSTLTVTKTAIALTRDGSAPQFSRVVFEQSIDNGATYTPLGTATNSRPAAARKDAGKFAFAPDAPLASGYTLSGLNLSSSQTILIRARGFYPTGYQNGSETSEDKVQLAYFALAPTAATVSISGRVMTVSGRGIRNVAVRLSDAEGNIRTAMTTLFGYYRFEAVAAGETYIITATGKRFTFNQSAQVLNITEDTEGINFIANDINYLLSNK